MELSLCSGESLAGPGSFCTTHFGSQKFDLVGRGGLREHAKSSQRGGYVSQRGGYMSQRARDGRTPISPDKDLFHTLNDSYSATWSNLVQFDFQLCFQKHPGPAKDSPDPHK